MTFQLFIMQAPSSTLPISNSESWNSWSLNWQPSRLWHGLTPSVSDSHYGNNSNRSDSLILQFRQYSSQPGCRGSHPELPLSVFFLHPARTAQHFGLCQHCCGCCWAFLQGSELNASAQLQVFSGLPFSVVPVHAQDFASVPWPVLTIRTACQLLRQNFDLCTIHFALTL